MRRMRGRTLCVLRRTARTWMWCVAAMRLAPRHRRCARSAPAQHPRPRRALSPTGVARQVFGHAKLKLNQAHYDKLRELWRGAGDKARDGAAAEDEQAFHRAMFCMLQRYKTLRGVRLRLGTPPRNAGRVPATRQRRRRRSAVPRPHPRPRAGTPRDARRATKCCPVCAPRRAGGLPGGAGRRGLRLPAEGLWRERGVLRLAAQLPLPALLLRLRGHGRGPCHSPPPRAPPASLRALPPAPHPLPSRCNEAARSCWPGRGARGLGA